MAELDSNPPAAELNVFPELIDIGFVLNWKLSISVPKLHPGALYPVTNKFCILIVEPNAFDKVALNVGPPIDGAVNEIVSVATLGADVLGVTVGVTLILGVTVTVGVTLGVTLGDNPGVGVALGVVDTLGVALGVLVTLGVTEGVTEGVTVKLGVGLKEILGVTLGVTVTLGVGLTDGAMYPNPERLI